MSQHINPTPKQTDIDSLNSKLISETFTLTPFTGGTVALDTTCVANGIVAVISMDVKSPSGSGWVNVATIPSKYKPKGALYFFGNTSNADSPIMGYISAQGTIQLRNPHDNISYYACVSYII